MDSQAIVITKAGAVLRRTHTIGEATVHQYAGGHQVKPP